MRATIPAAVLLLAFARPASAQEAQQPWLVVVAEPVAVGIDAASAT